MSERKYCHTHSKYDCQTCADEILSLGIQADKDEIQALRNQLALLQADRVQFCHSCLTIGDSVRCCPDAPGSVDMVQPNFALAMKRNVEASNADRDIAVMRASITAYKEARNGIERHPGNTAHENAAWEWGRKDGGWS